MHAEAHTMATEATAYARQGWAVFPLAGKVPAIKSGRGCLDATSDASQVAQWWQEYPNAGIGLACGAVSGVWVLDIDTKAPARRVGEDSTTDGESALLELEMLHGALPPTLMSITGSGGRHYFWRMPAGVDVRNAQGLRTPTGIRSGIDVRGTGGYVVLPPSRHPNGQTYCWAEVADQLAEAPGWLLEIVTGSKAPARTAAPVVQPAPSGDRRRRYGDKVLQGAVDRIALAAEGSRHGEILRAARYVGGFVASGFIAEETARLMLIEAGGAAGKRSSEVARTVADGLEDGKRTPIDPSQRPGWDRSEPAPSTEGPQPPSAPWPDPPPDLRPVEEGEQLQQYEPPQPPRTGADLPAVVEDCPLRRGDETELADILHAHHLGPFVVHTNGAMWQYRPSRRGWVRLTEEELMTWVGRLAGAAIFRGRNNQGEVKRAALQVSAAKARGTVRMAGARVYHDEDLGDFWAPDARGGRRGIAQFSDAAVIVTQAGPGRLAIEVTEPHPDLRVRSMRVLPCPWRGLQPLDRIDEQCPALWRIHLEWWGHHGAVEARARLMSVLEFLGASVLGLAPMMARALFLYGAGGTGKSSLIELMTRWCQPTAVASVTPQDMGINRFASARLDGAVLNVVDDLRSDPIQDAGAWKSAITGGRIDVERKGRDGYGIYPQAGHLYAGNRLPVAIKANSGFWRRWLVIHYDRVFHRTPDDRPIVHELMAEVDRIMAVAVSAFIQTGGAGGRGYTEPGCHQSIMAEWDRVSDSVSAFAADHLRDPGQQPKQMWPKRSHIYRKYRGYCGQTGRHNVSAEEFSNRVRDLGHGVAKIRGIWRVGCELVHVDEQGGQNDR
jgi:P4 family phage/plasmid primase-like protien